MDSFVPILHLDEIHKHICPIILKCGLFGDLFDRRHGLKKTRKKPEGKKEVGGESEKN